MGPPARTQHISPSSWLPNEGVRGSRPSSLLKAHRVQTSHSLGSLGGLGLPLCANQRGEGLAGGRREEWCFPSGSDFKESLWSTLVFIERWDLTLQHPEHRTTERCSLVGWGGLIICIFPEDPPPLSLGVFALPGSSPATLPVVPKV